MKVAERFPIAIRSRVDRAPHMDEWIRGQLAAKLDHAASLIRRATVRFEDVNGPKGGDDTVCRIKIVVDNRPSAQVEERAGDARTAFLRALPVIARSIGRVRSKHGLRGSRRRAQTARSAHATERAINGGEIIGRRVGRGTSALAAALERPEKQRRDAYDDTAAPGVSASDRRAGGTMSARRNTRANTSRATATLEDSRTTPSRKSTRKSANRGKPSQGRERTAVSRSVTPAARAARAARAAARR